MNGKLLLDTSAVIAILADEGAVLAAVTEGTECLLPSIVLGELYYGANRSVRVAENVATIQALCANFTVLPCEEVTAIEYGRIKNELRAKGRPIPENDIWIAAIASQHRLELLSRDVHFDEVGGLKRKTW